MNKVYLITYNPDAVFNKTVFHSHVLSLYPKHISDWWHHIDSAYLVVSTLNVNQLYNLVFPGVPGKYLLIIEVDPNNAQGWLPNNAWSWLQKYQRKIR